MTGFDFCVVGILAASLLLGLWRGLVSEVLALAAWVLALVAGKMFAAEVAPVLAGLIKDATLQVIVCFRVDRGRGNLACRAVAIPVARTAQGRWPGCNG